MELEQNVKLGLPFDPGSHSDEPTLAMWRELEERYGQVPALIQVIANSAELPRAWVGFVSALRKEEGENTARVQEIVILQVAMRTSNSYEFEHHKHRALDKELLTTAEISHLGLGTGEDQWNEPERAALRLADDIAEGRSISQADLSVLVKEFSVASAVRLVVLASFYVAIGRIVKGLDLDLGDD
jgi:hypothetical protein